MHFRLIVVAAVSAGLLAACAVEPEPGVNLAGVCQDQGYAPGTEAYRVCTDARGAEVATGPGSPYANADEEDDPGG